VETNHAKRKVPVPHFCRKSTGGFLFTKIAQVGSPLMNPAKNLRFNSKEKQQTKCKLYVKVIMPYTLITVKKEMTGLTQNGKARQNKMLIKTHCTLESDG
jgi:hypothetical protein